MKDNNVKPRKIIKYFLDEFRKMENSKNKHQEIIKTEKTTNTDENEIKQHKNK